MADVAVADIRSTAFVREKVENPVDAAARRKTLRKRLFIAFGVLLAVLGARLWRMVVLDGPSLHLN